MLKMKKLLVSGLLILALVSMAPETVKALTGEAGLDPPAPEQPICLITEEETGEIQREGAGLARSASTGALQVRWKESLGSIDQGLMSLGDPFNVSIKYVDESDRNNLDMRGKNRMLYCLQYHRNGPIGQVTWDKGGSVAPQIAYLAYWGSRYLGTEAVWSGYRTGYGWKYDVAATQYAIHIVNNEYSLNTLYSHLKGPKRDHFYSIIKKMSDDAKKPQCYTPFQGGWENLQYSLSDTNLTLRPEYLGSQEGYATKWISQNLWDGAVNCKEYINTVKTSIDHNGRVVWKDQGINGDFKIWIPKSEYLKMQVTGGKVTVNLTGTHSKCLAGWVYKSNKPETDQNVTMLEGSGGNVPHAAVVTAEVPIKKTDCRIQLQKKDKETQKAEAQGNGSLAGAEYQIKDQKGAVVDTLITAEDGTAVSTSLPLGTYYVQETKPSPGYGLDPEIYTVIFENTEVGTVEYRKTVVSEEPSRRGRVLLKKISSLNEKPLSGVRFTLFTEKGVEVGQYKTDRQGMIQVDNLIFGSYYFQEQEPPEGYEPDHSKILFLIDESCMEAAAQVLVTNKPKKLKLILTKEIKAEEINFANGNPIFIFEVKGKDLEGKEHVYHETVEFTEAYVKEHTNADGTVRQQVEISDLLAGYYYATELNVMRYSQVKIKEVVNGFVKMDKVHFDLVHKDQAGAVFENGKEEWSDWSDTGLCKNIIKRK